MKFNSYLNKIKEYVAGKPIEQIARDYQLNTKDIIKLGSNENPYGPSPKVIQTLKQNSNSVHMYPDDSFYELKSVLAKKFDVNENEIIFGCGSDQIIELAVRAKAKIGDNVLTAGLTFAMYKIAAQSVGANLIKTDSLIHNLDELYTKYKKDNPSVIFLCLPNNPIGDCLDTDEVYSFLEKIDSETLVFVDGAYQEFASYKDKKKHIDIKDLINRFDNVVYSGTFSKLYGLGGMRIGYGISKSKNLKALYKLRPPFNVASLSISAALSALEDEDYINEYLKHNLDQMKRYEDFIVSKGYSFVDSYTNFIQLEFKEDINSSVLASELMKRGIIIRDMSSYGINGIRITIGTSLQNDIVLKNLDELL
ncbi:MAG: Biosynthetic Aromatic amino acid aminotransferase beta (EC @ Histidinol-phosphate aminotransferase (EC [uncultured Campylobacterales bacterium]|uniref:Histidinol-phosphate aminotransferase n=1 Tax=uncultured Campylobacterales bacterium TaxID=352960 RepID=A0A6S6SX06_9BACT|nr:MAG: Biosynthetic Aromatic amino acid aminotransferase beta (EC @ Histidinol-phosphate aminotransferase (EC [uncultured Campylobacterales bacterium]